MLRDGFCAESWGSWGLALLGGGGGGFPLLACFESEPFFLLSFSLSLDDVLCRVQREQGRGYAGEETISQTDSS